MIKIAALSSMLLLASCVTTPNQTEKICFDTFIEATEYYFKKYRAIPHSMGGMDKGGVVLLGNQAGNWMLVKTIPNGKSCEMEKGPAWIIFTQVPQGQPL